MLTVIRGALAGTHPLSEPLIQKILDFKYGRDLKNPVLGLFQQDLESLINLQQELGFPLISSGSLGIEDLIRPFTRSLECLNRSYQNLGDLPIVRWHHTNTFYRRPSLVDKFPEDSRVLLEDTNFLSEKSAYSHEALASFPSRIIIPGPVSLVSLVDIDNQKVPYQSKSEIIVAAGAYLAQEIEKLPNHYEEIQLDEPVLSWQRFPRRLYSAIHQAYQVISSLNANDRRLIVNTYFEDITPILDFLLDLPVDGVGIDLIATNLTSLATKNFEGKILQVGIVDSQNYLPTSNGALDFSVTPYLVRIVQAMLTLNPDELIVTSNTGLEYLPRPIADAKLRLISRIIEEVA